MRLRHYSQEAFCFSRYENRPTGATPEGSRGFTLVELLVVITILAVLVMLIVPAVKSGINAANKAKCLNNLRQIQTGCIEYAADNNGWFPSTNRVFGYPHEFRNFETTLGPYIERPREKIMFCPGDLMKVRNSKYRPNEYETIYTTYQYFNFTNMTTTKGFDLSRLSRVVTAPVGVAMWGCLTIMKSGGITLAHSEPEVKAPISGMNAVYPDGHAAWVQITNLEVYNNNGGDYYWPKPQTNL